jgi:NTP pyrophosphatase (non-canonical NTP hydrolase)
MNEKLRKIVSHYGIKKQLKYFQSEIFELNEAIIEYRESERNPIDVIVNICNSIVAPFQGTTPIDKTAHIKEEIADVMVMLKQIQLYYNISTNDIRKIMNEKVNRQLDRIEKEKVGGNYEKIK